LACLVHVDTERGVDGVEIHEPNQSKHEIEFDIFNIVGKLALIPSSRFPTHLYFVEKTTIPNKNNKLVQRKLRVNAKKSLLPRFAWYPFASFTAILLNNRKSNTSDKRNCEWYSVLTLLQNGSRYRNETRYGHFHASPPLAYFFKSRNCRFGSRL